MPTITVRNVPAKVVQSLKALARRHRRSMEQEVRDLIEGYVVERRADASPRRHAARIGAACRRHRARPHYGVRVHDHRNRTGLRERHAIRHEVLEDQDHYRDVQHRDHRGGVGCVRVAGCERGGVDDHTLDFTGKFGNFS